MSLLKPLFFTTMALIFASCSAQNESSVIVKSPDQQNIIGGREVTNLDSEASYVAMIYGEDETGVSFTCTGTFISESALLTAAHCIAKDLDLISIFYGAKPFQTNDVQILAAVDSIKHPKYQPNAKTDRNDLGIIFFSGGLPKGAKIASPISKELKPTLITQLRLLGYGQAGSQESMVDPSLEAGQLRVVDINISEGLAPYSSSIDFNQSSGKGACFGDSGGPAFTKDKQGAISLLGVASAVIDTTSQPQIESCHFQSVYMSTEWYTDWIKATLIDQTTKHKVAPPTPEI